MSRLALGKAEFNEPVQLDGVEVTLTDGSSCEETGISAGSAVDALTIRCTVWAGFFPTSFKLTLQQHSQAVSSTDVFCKTACKLTVFFQKLIWHVQQDAKDQKIKST